MTMILLPVLLLLWGVPLSTATGRLRRFYSIDSRMLINEARNVCRSNYTDLVTIYDEEENNELIGILKNNTNSVSGWIGASSCKWSNGELVTFTNYSATFNEEKCCGVINTDGRWDCINCTSTKKYFMCYDQGLGQQSYNYSLIRENRSWFEAQMYCRENHTDLVTIRDEEENDRVKEARNGSDSFWIGLQYNNSLDWFDGGYSDYKQNSSSQGCFTYLSSHKNNTQGGHWFKANNGSYSALCYKSFIHVSEKNMSWEDARHYCDCNFSGLLRIESENDQIETERELKRRNISGPVWVGLKEIRLWTWTSGLQVVNWSNWKEGSQPENEHCGAIEKVDGRYKWCAKNCTMKYRVLCEMKQGQSDHFKSGGARMSSIIPGVFSSAEFTGFCLIGLIYYYV
ncbi:macrophage mannose receptor 1-like [Pimephales promelas]|uniref:macrophage mannose receptor 1-like n=1 Tax=Pimephales promelas TaxID=90988 RepID=UPI0019555ABB|nr:macrophage mannose receptor 1-like [Pimephales promelas]